MLNDKQWPVFTVADPNDTSFWGRLNGKLLAQLGPTGNAYM
jgi:hypothetical protein